MSSAFARFRQAWGAGNPDAARDLFTEDVVFGSPRGEVVTGRDEVMTVFRVEGSEWRIRALFFVPSGDVEG